MSGGFPPFSGKVRIVLRTLSGLFLVGAVNRASKRKRTKRENSQTSQESPETKKGKIPKDKKKRVQIGKPPPRKTEDLHRQSSGVRILSLLLTTNLFSPCKDQTIKGRGGLSEPHNEVIRMRAEEPITHRAQGIAVFLPLCLDQLRVL